MSLKQFASLEIVGHFVRKLNESAELMPFLFLRLLTWRPAGAEGEHSTTQSLSDKQLVRQLRNVPSFHLN